MGRVVFQERQGEFNQDVSQRGPHKSNRRGRGGSGGRFLGGHDAPHKADEGDDGARHVHHDGLGGEAAGDEEAAAHFEDGADD